MTSDTDDQVVRAAHGLERVGPLHVTELFDVSCDVGRMWFQRTDLFVGPAIQKFGCWEPAISRLIRDRLRPGGTFLDVGAQAGYLSLLGADAVGPSGRVVAVEPDPVALALLRANLWRNGVENATVIPAAALDRRDHVSIGRSVTGLGIVRDDLFGGGLAMPGVPLDEVLNGVRVDVAKLDCELTDHLALRGLRDTISASSGITVLVEFVAVDLDRRANHLAGSSAAEVLAEYRALDMRLQLLRDDGTLAEAGDDELLEQEPGVVQTLVLTGG